MRILFLLSSLEVGGAQMQVLNLSSHLLARGHEVMITSMTDILEMESRFRAIGASVDSLHLRRGVPDPRGLLRIVDLMRRWRPHVLVSFMFHANILGRLAGCLVRGPAIISSIRTERFNNRLEPFLMRATNRLHNMTVVNSSRVAERLLQQDIISPKRCMTIPNGIDLNRFQTNQHADIELRRELGAGPDDFLWVAIGRLHKAKGYPTLLEAFRKAVSHSPKTVMAIVGEGTDSPALVSLAHELGIVERLRLVGARRDIPAILASADGLVLSSHWEGLPNVVMEASAAGKPVVATDVGGVRELLVDGVSGFVVQSGDADDIAAGMMKMVNLPVKDRERLGRKGQLHMFENYALDKVAKQWEDLFENILNSKL